MAFRPSVVIYKKFFPSSFPMCALCFVLLARYLVVWCQVETFTMATWSPHIHDETIEVLHMLLQPASCNCRWPVYSCLGVASFLVICASLNLFTKVPGCKVEAELTYSPTN